METLPTEMIFELCKYLDYATLVSLSHTCQKFHAIIASIPIVSEEINTLHLDNFVFSTLQRDPVLRAKHFMKYKDVPLKIAMTHETLTEKILKQNFDSLYIGKYSHYRCDFTEMLELIQEKNCVKNVYIGHIHNSRCTSCCFNFLINWMINDCTGIKFHLAPDLELFYNQNLNWKIVENLTLKLTFNVSQDVEIFFNENVPTRRFQNQNEFDKIKAQVLTSSVTLNLELNDFVKIGLEMQYGTLNHHKRRKISEQNNQANIQQRFLKDFKFLKKLINLKNLTIEVKGEDCFFGHERVEFLGNVKVLQITGNQKEPCQDCINSLVSSIHKDAKHTVVLKNNNVR